MYSGCTNTCQPKRTPAQADTVWLFSDHRNQSPSLWRSCWFREPLVFYAGYLKKTQTKTPNKQQTLSAFCAPLCMNVRAHVVWCMPAVLSVNTMRTYGYGPLWSVQINWITGNLGLNQVRQIAYQGVGGVGGGGCWVKGG